MDELPPRSRWRKQWSDNKMASPEHTQPTNTMEGSPSSPNSPTEWTTIVFEVKVPASKERISIEMDVNHTVLNLKERVLEQEKMYPVPVDRVVLQSHKTHVVLLDGQLLKDCAVFDYSDNEIDVYLKPPAQQPRTVVLKVTVLPMNSKSGIEVEVNAEDNVAVLREKVEQVHRRVRFRLPTGGRYFFVHNHNPMDERKSFRWHDVRYGDTIGTFDGFFSTDHKVAKED